MDKTILITYASAFDSTAEIAAEIGKTITERGFRVDVIPVTQKPDPDSYGMVILGSTIQYSNILPEAQKYVDDHLEALQAIPVALFCTHIANHRNNSKETQKRLAYLNPQRDMLKPFSEAFFRGKVDRRAAAYIMPKLLARFFPVIDYRDWRKIRRWAENIELSHN